MLLCTLCATAQQFIGCRVGDTWAETPMLRTTFHVDADDLTPSSYRSCYFGLVFASLGYHEVYLNGEELGDWVMQPAVSQLDKRALWVEYDITPYLHEGDNELMLWIGQGWGRIYGTPAVVQATVRKSVSDGECGLIYEILKTDSTWEASPSGYSYTGSWQPMQFGGERYDARVKPAWRRATVYNAKDITVTRQEFAGNHVVDVVKVNASTKQPDGSLILDFGRVLTGWIRAEFEPLEAGREVTMEYMDHRGAKPPHTETDIYISDGSGKDVFVNRFHMHSFRYVRVNGTDKVKAWAYPISAVDPKQGATFECSDPRLNAIHDMVKYTLSCLTFSGYMVDCPHIERMGYGGDGNSSTNTLQTLWDVRPTYANWLQAWHDAMDSTGDLPYVAPAFRTGGGPYWQGFIVKAPWRTYVNYGDRTLINRHYNDMKRWLEYIEQHCEDYILQPWPDNDIVRLRPFGRDPNWFLGDWAVPDGVDKGGESVMHASSCFIADCLGDMIQMARMTGNSADALCFADWRERLLKEIHRHFYHPETNTYANGTPLDQCYALLMGIPPDSATAAAVKARLLKDCHGKYRDHIAAGLMGVPVFTEWCIREKQAGMMAAILRQPDYPGYLHMINNGATTTWESWDCGRQGKEDRSRVHNCYNGIGTWFYQALAGIRPDPEQPGYKHFFVDPQPVEGVDWVSATLPTLHGTIRLNIDDTIIKITVPPGTTATLFPGTDNQRLVHAGDWEIDLKKGKTPRLRLLGGDLLFVRGGDSDMEEAISASTGQYTHVAMVEVDSAGRVWVIEATTGDGVRRMLHEEWRKSNGGFDVYRLSVPFDTVAVVARAKSYLGQPYDDAFLPANGAMYCSELIYEAYLGSNGNHLFKSQPMVFRDKEGRMPPYWTEHFRKLGMEVPENVSGTNPTDMSRSPILKRVY